MLGILVFIAVYQFVDINANLVIFIIKYLNIQQGGKSIPNLIRLQDTYSIFPQKPICLP